MNIKINSITHIVEDEYSVSFTYKSDFGQFITVTQNIEIDDINDKPELMDLLADSIPTYHCK